MNKEITLREVIFAIALIFILAPIFYPIYKEKKEEEKNNVVTETPEVAVSSDLVGFSVNEMYKNSCLDQTYCPDGNNIYIKYGDFVFVIFKKESDDSILGILINDEFKGHVLNDSNCSNEMCSYKYVKLNSTSSGVKDVIEAFESYLPSNKDEVLIPINYSTGYIDINNKYTDDTSYESRVFLINWEDYQQVGTRSYMFNIDTLLSTVRYSVISIGEGVDHYWSNGGSSRLSGIYVSNGTRLWVSPLNRDNYPIRPVISINTKSKIIGGEGTVKDPYVIP